MRIKILLILFVFVSCMENKNTVSSDETKTHKKNDLTEKERVMDSINFDKHRVVKIDSIGDVFLIYTKKNGIYFKILTDRVNDKGCNEVLIGEYYDIEIKSAFPEKDKFSYKVQNFGILYNDQDIEIERDSINDLHFAENIKGLCMIDE